ncbi:hypothetical protein CsSME_00032211 [Camellia sinensis var. sinensis]
MLRPLHPLTTTVPPQPLFETFYLVLIVIAHSSFDQRVWPLSEVTEFSLLCECKQLREAGKTKSRLAKMGFGDEESKIIKSLRCALVEVEAAT